MVDPIKFPDELDVKLEIKKKRVKKRSKIFVLNSRMNFAGRNFRSLFMNM